MKRTFKRPDGTEEVFEGTAEELAEYERKLKKESEKPRPDVLKGKSISVGDVVDGQPVTEQEIDAAFEWVKVVRGLKASPPTFPVAPQVSPWPVVCQKCYCSPCCCAWYRTFTTTSDRVEVPGLLKLSLRDIVGMQQPIATCNCRERCVECQSDGYSDWGGHH